MSQSETQHSPNSQRIIRYGPDDDSVVKVKNVKVFLNDDTVINALEGFSNTDYDNVNIMKNCNGVTFLFFKDSKLVDALEIPIHNITKVTISYGSKDTRST